MNPINFFFNTNIRINRAAFWTKCMITWLVFGCCQVALSNQSDILMNCVALITLSCLIIHSIQRLHDRGYSGWWLLINVLPVLGSIWLFWQLACCRGQASSNPYGEEPTKIHTDFLVVKT